MNEVSRKKPLNFFDSPSEFLTFCDQNGINGDQYGMGNSSWYGDESESLCRKRQSTGRLDLVAQIEADLLKHHRLQQLNLQVRSWEPEPYGAYPMVGDYLAGSPTSMRMSRQIELYTSGIRIFISTTSSADISASQLFKRGVVISAFIRALGAIRPVDAYVLITGDGHGDTGRRSGATAIAIKVQTNPMDLPLVAWACSSVRLTRGFGHHFMSWANRFDGGWPWNTYHHHTVTERMREFLGLNSQDVLLPPINLDDALLTNPYEWLETMLKQYLPETV